MEGDRISYSVKRGLKPTGAGCWPVDAKKKPTLRDEEQRPQKPPCNLFTANAERFPSVKKTPRRGAKGKKKKNRNLPLKETTKFQ